MNQVPRRRFLAVVLMCLVVQLAGPLRATARATGSDSEITPPFTSLINLSTCDDGGGSAICTTSVGGDKTNGSMSAAAALQPVGASASGGNATARVDLITSHRLKSGVPGLRYTFTFTNVTGAASSDPSSSTRPAQLG